MNPEIENLINMALADGEVTEKERAIILRTAEALGFDRDEVEMILDGKIALQKKELSHSESSKENTSNKAGDIKKCPSCGSTVTSFNTNCIDCGHEFRNIEADTSISKLFDLLMEAETSAKDNTIFGSIGNLLSGREDTTTEKKRNIIANFPIPNSKESIIEFLSTAFPKAKKATIFNCFNGHERYIRNLFVEAWKSKCEQIIMKARFSMKDDKKTLDELEYYAKQLGIK